MTVLTLSGWIYRTKVKNVFLLWGYLWIRMFVVFLDLSSHCFQGGFYVGLFPVRSPSLGKSLLVSFPLLIDTLKFSGCYCQSSGRVVWFIHFREFPAVWFTSYHPQAVNEGIIMTKDVGTLDPGQCHCLRPNLAKFPYFTSKSATIFKVVNSTISITSSNEFEQS
jgi:hypothetical protein